MAIFQVASCTESTELLDAAPRSGATVYNNSNKNMYISFGEKSSTNRFTVLLPQSSYWEVPESYKGSICAVWAVGCSGDALVTMW